MKQFIFYCCIGIFLSSTNLLAQKKFVKLTYRIADTNQSKYNQALDVYHWITGTISYDTKAYQKGQHNGEVQKTIRTKKGLCEDYSLLFKAFCDQLEIPCFTIHGYTKGHGYVAESNFYRANHAWNVFYTDSVWCLVDPTWGSGVLDYKLPITHILHNFLSRDERVKTRLIFIKAPNDAYFNSSPDSLILSHYPLGIQWQLVSTPVTYHQFITDSVEAVGAVNLQKVLEEVRLKGNEFAMAEANRSANEYNQFNYFNPAIQDLKDAQRSMAHINQQADSVISEAYGRKIALLDSARVKFRSYKAVSNQLLKAQRAAQKQGSRYSKNAFRGFLRIPSVNNDRYFKTTRRWYRYNGKLEQHQLECIESKRKLPIIFEGVVNATSFSDSTQFTVYTEKVQDDTRVFHEYALDFKTKSEQIDALFEFFVTDLNTIPSQVSHMLDDVIQLQLGVNTMDQTLILKSSSSFYKNMICYDSLFDARKRAYAYLQDEFNRLSTQFSKVENKHHSLLRSYQKLCSLSSNDSLYEAHLTTLMHTMDNTYSSYLDKIEKMRLHYKDWITIYSSMNDLLKKYPYHLLVNLNKDTQLYYQYIIQQTSLKLQNENRIYTNYIDQIKELKASYKGAVKAL